ncbi:MAG: hypothetical protein AAF705_06630 [Bacteroidota bacterium]
MSALIIAIYIFLGGYFGTDHNGPIIWEDYQYERSFEEIPQTQSATEWEQIGG